MFESDAHTTGVHYLSVDPGESTGYAAFDSKGELVDLGISRSPAEFVMLLHEMSEPPKVIVLEQFTLYQSKALQQSGSNMVASRVIGAVEAYALVNKCEVVYQPASIKKIAEMWTGKKPPSNHKESHNIDAYNHGMYYLIKNKIRKPTK